MPIYLTDFIVSYAPSPTATPPWLAVRMYVYSTEALHPPRTRPIYKRPSFGESFYLTVLPAPILSHYTSPYRPSFTIVT